MNEASAKAKQQIVEKIRSSSNILITVSRDPSVDALSAALGLTALLNKLDKHATAIFSGAIPPALSFLEPDKLLENTADSLRDFIIALDKEKADHLRYKVEGDVVKIFITPYRTTITADDLNFSQGNYNVDLVLALGIDDKNHLDAAISAHGQILDDAVVATITAGNETSDLGSLAWHDAAASCLSEMVVGILDGLKDDKPLLDKQIATALMTGVVAATDRFSNDQTTSQIMTIAAQLMAAGADQQLIATKLRDSHEITTISEFQPTESEPASISQPVVDNDGSLGGLSIKHEEPMQASIQPTEEPIEPERELTPELAQEIINSLPKVSGEPSLGGTLSATTEEAAEEKEQLENEDQNKTILEHSYLAGSSSAAPINGIGQDEDGENVDIFSQPSVSTLPPESSQSIEQPTISTVTEPDLQQQPIVPPVVDMPLPPPLPDFSTLPPPPAPSVPPMPDFGPSAPSMPQISTLPPEDANDPSKFHIPGQN